MPEAEANACTPQGRIGTSATSSSFASPACAVSVSRTMSPSGTSNGSNRTSSTPSSLISSVFGIHLLAPAGIDRERGADRARDADVVDLRDEPRLVALGRARRGP